jgi:hypothetical protein
MSYRLTGEGYVIRVADGAKVPITTSVEFPNTNPDYLAYLAWLDAGNTPLPAAAPTAEEQLILDQNRYQKRAAVQAELMSWMAADNMSRVRSGVWTVPQLTSLLSDPAVQAAQTYMSTLSYELAAQAIASATTPLLTPEIKAAWVAKLQAHFYLVP